MTSGKPIRLPHILYFSTLRNWLTLLARYGGQIHRSHWFQAVCITVFVICTIPIRVVESLLFSARVRRHKLHSSPVFIIGHWRSGTTNMHNHFLQDPQFASVTLLHCSIPAGFLTQGWLARLILNRRLPKSRPMDAVPLGVDEPMSEDFALAGLTHMSHYLNYFFPAIAERTFRETVLFEGVQPGDVQNYLETYDFLLRKVSFAAGGKRLLLKNPPNLGRVAEILSQYPDAKFIHVYRNPFLVHASTMKLMERFLEQMSFQDWNHQLIEDFVSIRYRLIMEKWLAEKSLIPAENLIEVRHEDVVANPVPVLEKVYRQFGLGDWEKLKPRFEAYAQSLVGYQNNEYRFDEGYIERILPFTGPFAAKWGYDVPAKSVDRKQGPAVA